jgi:hypothetical protein
VCEACRRFSWVSNVLHFLDFLKLKKKNPNQQNDSANYRFLDQKKLNPRKIAKLFD